MPFGFERLWQKASDDQGGGEPGMLERRRRELEDNDRALRGTGTGPGGGGPAGGPASGEDGRNIYRGLDGKLYRKGELHPME